MTNLEIQKGWERAERLAIQIWEAYVTGIAVENARKAQKTLKVWLDLVRENGYIYNGSLDKYVVLRL